MSFSKVRSAAVLAALLCCAAGLPPPRQLTDPGKPVAVELAPLSGIQLTADSLRTALVSWDQMLAFEVSGARAPERLPEEEEDLPDVAAIVGPPIAGDVSGTAPHYGLRFPTLDLQTSRVNPPDTMGAVGRDHFMEVINGRVGVFDKRTGARLSHVSTTSFFGVVSGTKFDPCVLFDALSGRWIASAARAPQHGDPWGIVLAVSRSGDPLGGWFQVFFHHPDFPQVLHDFPMLGVGPQSICVNACVCDLGGARSLWAFEKAPLLADPPRLGSVTRWDVEEDQVTLVPVHSNGPLGADLVLGIGALGGSLGIYFLEGPMTAPTLRLQGALSAPWAKNFAGPAPAPGIPEGDGVSTGLLVSSAPVYRNRTVWLVFRSNVDNRGAFHWMRVNPFTTPPQLVDSGTVSHPSLHLYLASLAVNRINDVAFGFAGSNEDTLIGAYFTGRRHDDPTGVTGPIRLLKAGEAVFGTGEIRRRWGDYTATMVDPEDDLSFWTIQQYAGARGQPNTWGTWVGRLSHQGFDCNANGREDGCDIACHKGCPAGCGGSEDCENNGVPDECEPAEDCDANGVRDLCEIALGTTLDCDADLIPDVCEQASDCNGNGIPDACETDCNGNQRPDDCDVSSGRSLDCNANRIPDECEVAPNRLLTSQPDAGISLWRSKRNVIRLRFLCDLPGPPVGGRDILITEMVEGGYFGPDLSANFQFSIEEGNILRIQDGGATLEHGRWYAVANAGWPGLQFFNVAMPVVMGDVNADGSVTAADLSLISMAVPTHPTADDERRDINGDRAVLFSDLSAARAHLPSDAVPRPPGH